MKSSTIFKTVAGAILLLSIAVEANNITYGYRVLYDRLLSRQRVFKPSSWWSTQSELVTYPPKGLMNYNTLTAIKAIDGGGPINFGYSQLVKGGPGHRNATLLLKSQWRKALNFTLEFYGR